MDVYIIEIILELNISIKIAGFWGFGGTAYVALELFLALNGVTFPASDAEATLTTLAMAAGDLDDPTFIAWVRRHAQPATSPG